MHAKDHLFIHPLRPTKRFVRNEVNKRGEGHSDTLSVSHSPDLLLLL